MTLSYKDHNFASHESLDRERLRLSIKLNSVYSVLKVCFFLTDTGADPAYRAVLPG